MPDNLDNWDAVLSGFGDAALKKSAANLLQRFLVTTATERPGLDDFDFIWPDAVWQCEWKLDGRHCWAMHFDRQSTPDEVHDDYFRLGVAAGRLLIRDGIAKPGRLTGIVAKSDRIRPGQSRPSTMSALLAWLTWLLETTDLKQLLLIDGNRGNWQTVPAFSHAITALRAKGKELAATGPYGEVWLWADEYLKGNQRKGVQTIAQVGGIVRLADLALALKWPRDYSDAWNSFQREVNKKFASHGNQWRLKQGDNCAKLSKES